MPPCGALAGTSPLALSARATSDSAACTPAPTGRCPDGAAAACAPQRSGGWPDGAAAERGAALRRAHRRHLALGGLGVACFALEDVARDQLACGFVHAAWHCLACYGVAGVNALLRDSELDGV